jgi:uncharacterized protein
MILNSSQTRIWAIADTHLSFAKPKDMARFGGEWVDHEATIAMNWRERIAADDIVLLPGDVSWAQQTSRIWADLRWLQQLPGRKVLLRGNHDHWWKAIENVRKIVEPMGFYALEGDSITMDGVVICGAMGHLAPHDRYYKEDPKKDRYHRELDRLEKALQHGAEARVNGTGSPLPLILMTHYPPFTSDGKRTDYVDLISRYQPTMCIYGHLHHRQEWEIACKGVFEGVTYRLVASDYLQMKPALIWPVESEQ